MVQLPEALESPIKLKDGTVLNTLSDVGRERIIRAIRKIENEKQKKLKQKEHEDLGFRSFNLSSSNYKPWDSTPQKTVAHYELKLEGVVDSLKPGWKAENVIYEVALKEGFSLTCSIEKLAGKAAIYKVTDGEQSFYIDLDPHITLAALKPLNLQKDTLFICCDIALDDTTAANLALQCRLKTI